MICRSCGYSNAPALVICNLCGDSLSVLPPRPKTEQFKRSDLGYTQIDRAIAKHSGKTLRAKTKEGEIARLEGARAQLADRLAQLIETHDEHTSTLQAQIDAAQEAREVEAQLEAALAEVKQAKATLATSQEEVKDLRKKVVDIRVVLNRAIELRLEALKDKEVLDHHVEHLRHLREQLRKGPSAPDEGASEKSGD